MEAIPLWLLYILLTIPFFYALFKAASQKLRPNSGNARLPPGPTALPLLGNLLDLRGDPHRALADLSKTYGPVMSLRLGAAAAATVVVSSADAARDVLQKHDQILAARSVTDAARALGHHERSIIWLPSSSALWRRLRAVSNNHLFSSRGLEATRAVRETKVQELVEYFRSNAGRQVDVGRAVFAGVLNLVANVLFSEDVGDLSSDTVHYFEELVKDTVAEVTKPNVSDLFPVLRALDLQGRRRCTARYIKRFDDLFDGVINRRLDPGGEKKEDFLDVLLQLHSMDQLSRRDINTFLLDLFAAGTDTSSITVEWAMAELLRNPTVMAKARTELNDALGSKHTVDESDIDKLPYLQAVIKEAMRLHPSSPLMMPHVAVADGVEIGGFEVPKDSKVIINLWAIMRDSSTWPEPEAFMPERFLGREIDSRGRDFEFMPFGSGRRACPRMPMAMRVVSLMLASMLHAFEWRLPEGTAPHDVDVSDRFGTSLSLAVPLRAVPVLV